MFINDRLQETGVPPSFDEMKDALSLKSKSGIHRLITALEERGFIRRLPHRARALEVLKMPGDQDGGNKCEDSEDAHDGDSVTGLDVVDDIGCCVHGVSPI